MWCARPPAGLAENDAEPDLCSTPINTEKTSLPPPSTNPDDLLDYYRNLVAQFDEERKSYELKLEQCSIARKEYYKVRWQLTQRDMEIAELQKALSDAHVHLYEEREQVLRLNAENQELKIQEMEDRKRIQHLLALTQPVTEEVTYFRDAPPNSLIRHTAIHRPLFPAPAPTTAPSSPPTTTPQQHTNATLVTKPHACGGSNSTCKKCSKCGKRNNVIRTIYLPNESVDALKAMVQSLQTQLADRSKLAEDEKKALLEDRQVCSQQREKEMQEWHERVATLQQQLQHTQQLLHTTTKDFFRLRYDFRQSEEKWHNERHALTQQTQQLQSTLQTISQQAQTRQQELVARVVEERNDHVEELRRQIMDREENTHIVQEQYAASQKLYQQRIQHLEHQYQQLRHKYGRVCQRREFERSGVKQEVALMKQQVKDVSRGLNHLKIAARRQQVLQQLDSTPPLIQLQDRLQKIADQLQAWMAE
eukprot:TRINITY_DN18226_c0_g1_i10.p1 TRINITY_DN18226_c0_g1~~TRINITY_DN18226_c0_g1_i10.p1  ORF type:complete len:477 (-),score=80.00 TRINITY_DN18226_c0_g1_i10:101-1531(-)